MLYSLIIKKFYLSQDEKYKKGLTWFEDAVNALSFDKPNYRPIINLMLADARELLLLSEKKDKKIYHKIVRFVNELERIYVKNKFIDSDTFLRLYFRLVNFKNILGVNDGNS